MDIEFSVIKVQCEEYIANLEIPAFWQEINENAGTGP